MNKKGFSLIDLVITISIICLFGSLVIPSVLHCIEDKKMGQKIKNIIREVEQKAKPEVKNKIKTFTTNRSIVKCIEGKKAIEIDGKIYYIGSLNTWGDIEGIECKQTKKGVK